MNDAEQFQTDQTIDPQQESILRDALNTFMVQFDRDLEQRYKQHSHDRTLDLINRSIYLMLGLYLLVVVPVILIVKTPEMAAWRKDRKSVV